MVRVLGFHVAAGVSSLEDLKREKLNILLRLVWKSSQEKKFGMNEKEENEEKAKL